MCRLFVSQNPGRAVILHNDMGRMARHLCALFIQKMLAFFLDLCYYNNVKRETPQGGGVLRVVAT